MSVHAHTYKREQRLPGSPDDVFAFFGDARNLEAITPPLLRFRVMDSGADAVEMGAGTLIRYRLRVHRVPVGWLTAIREWDPPHRFVDEQLRGPYALWHHTHTFEPIEDGAATLDFPEHLRARGAVFRRRHRLYGPMVLYGGRIDPGKGCEELIQYFTDYVKEGGDATLVLMGSKLMVLPEEPYIRFAGRLSDRERLQALEAATVVVCPSPYESLSLLALEALSVGTPILCNARSAVLVEHCVRSNGGLFYADRDEFVESLKLLVADDKLRAALGRNGAGYVRQNYRWDAVLAKYERLFAKIRNAR